MITETKVARGLNAGSGEDPRSGARRVRRTQTRATTAWWHVGIIVLFAGLSCLANLSVWTHGVAHTLQTSGGTDVQEEIWFLAQTPWALLHGISPFANNTLNYPLGVNLMDNTSMLLLGIIGWPVTVTLGPIATFNIFVDLGFTTAAAAGYFAALRFCSWRPAAAVAGAVYGFSPFFVAEGSGHLFLLFGAVPPLVVLIVDRYLVSGQGAARWGGALLGVCLVAQFYVSTEVFSSVLVMSLVAAVVMGFLAWRRHVQVDVRRLIEFLVATGSVCIVGVGYAVWVALAGSQHIVGPAQTRVALAGISIDPLSLVIPTLNQHFTLGHAALGDSLVAGRSATWQIVFDAPLENGGYLGVPLILLLLGGVMALRKRRGVVALAAIACVALVLAMGTHLHVDGHLTNVPLPFDVISHLPLLDSSVAARYMEFFWLGAALLVGIVLDALFWRAAGASGEKAVVGALITALVAAASLVLLLPQWPYSTATAKVPRWFTDHAKSIPLGGAVVVYPFSSSLNATAMVWQAEADDRFKMPGGYAVFATATGSATFASQYTPLQSVLASCSMPTPSQLSSTTVRAQLDQWKADAVIVVRREPGAGCAAKLFESALGRPSNVGQVLVWSTYRVQDPVPAKG